MIQSAGVVSVPSRGVICAKQTPTRQSSLHPGVRRQHTIRRGQRHHALSLEDAVYTYIAAAGDVEAPNGALIAAALGCLHWSCSFPLPSSQGLMLRRRCKSGYDCVLFMIQQDLF